MSGRQNFKIINELSLTDFISGTDSHRSEVTLGKIFSVRKVQIVFIAFIYFLSSLDVWLTFT